MTVPETRSRFRREAEILGRLQHPGIGQIFEAGEFEQEGRRRPFIALEFVEGLSLLEHAKLHDLSTRARIDLFLRVCLAVEYAHERGVVHRDLKPDNILVLESSTLGADKATSGIPKVLDFGVARLVDDEQQVTLTTNAGQLLGSVPYMSPEQARGSPGDIDRRSDIYSLGVVLFELLSGQLPHNLREQPLSEALDRIRNAEPASLGEVDARHRGDLQTIVGKCLEKDPRRRYSTVTELARDLQRHCQHEPIHARPPSTLYQLTKLARRHRGLTAGIVVAMLSLSIGLGIAIDFAIKASHSELAALKSRDVARSEAYRANLSAASALLEVDPGASRQALDDVPPDQRGWEWEYLNSRLSADLLSFGSLGNKAPYPAAAPMQLVDQGQTIASAASSTRIEYRSTSTGVLLHSVEAEKAVSAWAVADHGRMVAAGFSDGRVEVLDLEGTGRWELWLEGGEPIGALAFRPGTRELAITSLTRLSVGARDAWNHRPMSAKRSDTPLLSFSGDGQRLAIVGLRSGTRYQVWQVDPLALLHDRTRPSAISSVGLDHDGTRLAFGETYSKVFVVDVESGAITQTLIGHERAVDDVVIEGTRLLSTSGDNSLRLWDTEDGKQLAIFHEPGVKRAVLQGQDRVISGSPARLRLWSLEPRRGKTLVLHRNYAYDLRFAPQGDLLASFSSHGRDLAFTDVRTAEVLVHRDSPSGAGRMGFGPESEQLWLGSSVDSWQAPWMFDSDPGVWGTHSTRVALCFDGRSRTLDFRQRSSAPLPPSKELQIWGASFPFVTSSTEATRSVRGTLEGATLELSGDDIPLLPFRAEESPRLFLGALNPNHAFFAGSIAELLLFDGELEESDSRALQLYLAARRANDPSAPNPDLPQLDSVRLIAHFRAEAASLELDPGSDSLRRWHALNDSDLVLERRGDRRHSMLWVAPRGQNQPGTVDIFHDVSSSHWLEAAFPAAAGLETLTAVFLGRASSPYHSAIFAIDSLDRRHARLPGRGPQILSPATVIVPEAQIQVEADLKYGRPAMVRDARSGEILQQLEGNYMGVAISPDGTRLVAGTAEGTVELWDLNSFERLAVVQGHAGQVFAVAVHPRFTRIATGGNDGVIVLRDPRTLAPLLELREHDMYVKALAFSPDGRCLVSASGDRSVRLWDTTPPAERYQEAMEARALESEVRETLGELRAQHPSPVDLLKGIRQRWPTDWARRFAAHRLIARGDGQSE